MFRLFSSTYIVEKAKNIGASTKPCTTHFLLQYPFPITSISTTTTDHTSFTISYLINSCGFSQDKAISASKKVQFKTSTKPDSVFALFRNHGFPNTHIAKIIHKCPSCLVSKEKTLSPKLDFFRSVGLSHPELAEFLAAVPFILNCSLENQIIPAFDLLKTLLGDHIDALYTLKRSALLLKQNPHKLLLPRIDVLRSYGIPDSRISSLLRTQPRSFLVSIDRLKEVAEQVKKMEFDPLEPGFIKAVKVLVGLGESGWETKADVYRRWGWSDDVIRAAFRREPNCMTLSEKNIMCHMEFFVNEAGYDPRVIANYPVSLMYSMKKRIIPRWKVMQLLVSNGLNQNNINFVTLVNLPEKRFIRKFVIKFKDLVPEILNLYQEKINGLESDC